MKIQFRRISLIAFMCFGILACTQGNLEKNFNEKSQYVQSEEEVLPKMDDFVPLDKAPAIDLNELATNIVYPEDAIRSGLEGKVMVSVFVDKYGEVKKTVIRESTSEIFNNSAIEAIKKTKFTSAELNGKSVSSWILIPIFFKLNWYLLKFHNFLSTASKVNNIIWVIQLLN